MFDLEVIKSEFLYFIEFFWGRLTFYLLRQKDLCRPYVFRIQTVDFFFFFSVESLLMFFELTHHDQ